MSRIRVAGAVAELCGDEMAAVMWQMVTTELVHPFLEIEIDRYDLSLASRDRTHDRVTVAAGHAVLEHGVGVKCATITPTVAQADEYGLAERWRSPNATLRTMLGGTIFRSPIIMESIPRLVPGWREPIVIARHAFGDQYLAGEITVPGPGTVTLTYTPDDGSAPVERTVARFAEPDGGGVVLGQHNTTRSIEEFARATFRYALVVSYPVYLTTKNTVLATYDGHFTDVFARVFRTEFAAEFTERGLTYEHRLIDDMVAAALRWPGGYVWACKNYDGDVHSDVVAQGFGSPGLMSSVLLTPDGRTCLTEAAHGTVTRHYRRHRRGEATSTNPIAVIHAWSRALAHRASLDGNERLHDFAHTMERSVVEVVDSGVMTADLAALVGPERRPVSTIDFVRAVGSRLHHIRNTNHDGRRSDA
ncbi:isocitrate dehydrogenase (NADP) [Rhodococcoides kroppenstedtii]|uniref:Isocitrate dehydrogenase [NADP] n=1 Tax=Rhodococcoides kroppenstedtii TaxID=293050 RepID=A0A1I0SQH2_9NOCA|nr:NADP-dependent isocitrate dehydrogenase [Rhodococcus kroppenstedtii]SFA41673.1 isocitrate dehydrogenase (NADP) [Rhodococcus kroppenstedtii]